jgi:ankyrin repeat protein
MTTTSNSVALAIAELMGDSLTIAVLACPGGTVNSKQLWLNHLRTAARHGRKDQVRRLIELGEKAGFDSSVALSGGV